MTREYIVVYEDTPSDDTDELVLDVDVESQEDGPYQVEADFGAAVTNEAGPAAVIGLIVTMVGGLVALATAGLILYYYPAAWWDQPPRETLARTIMGLGLLSALLLIVGNLMVGLGRNLRARGVLHSLRFTPQR